ncbi:MAG: diguanylate cyclase response regulator [Herminiimonas sp.]|nr:diguanylate cyclase response regulator [Herminiimonas sp.]
MTKHPLAKPALRIAKNEAHISLAAPSDAHLSAVADPRRVWIVADAFHPWVAGLREQLRFFGFHVQRAGWDEVAPEGPSPLAILFIPPSGYGAGELIALRRIHALHPASRVVCLAVPELMDPMLALLRAGADITVPVDQKTSTVLAHVLNLAESHAQEPYRVLVVEDSPTAIAIITRALSRHGIDSHPVGNPEQLLREVVRYRPDLVLMDVNMPHCSGIEATRILRQIPACQSLPVVYLSGETDPGVQGAALRLGGDQFINKPFNPVLLATVVKTKIQRNRE